MIHVTIGVYPNGPSKTNGVSSENIATHIWYNLTYRPGRALIVDGIVIHKGIGVAEEKIKEHVLKAESGEIRHEKDTAPYQ